MAGAASCRRRLSPADWPRLAGLCLLLPAVAASLRLRGYCRTRALLHRLTPVPGHAETGADDCCEHARHLARLIAIAAARGPCRARCLTRSLLLEALLRRRGLEPELQFGTRRERSKLHAHAWVTLDGAVINDRGDIAERYPAMAPRD